jgi:hypothetical protein
VADSLTVERVRMRNGEAHPALDENAYDEQAKAAMICLKVMERLAKLLGLDLEPQHERPMNLQELQLKMVEWDAIIGTKLELRSGLDEEEDLTGTDASVALD